jgi:hypothetical protein
MRAIIVRIRGEIVCEDVHNPIQGGEARWKKLGGKFIFVGFNERR